MAPNAAEEIALEHWVRRIRPQVYDEDESGPFYLEPRVHPSPSRRAPGWDAPSDAWSDEALASEPELAALAALPPVDEPLSGAGLCPVSQRGADPLQLAMVVEVHRAAPMRNGHLHVLLEVSGYRRNDRFHLEVDVGAGVVVAWESTRVDF
ncbi:MAG: hypothetical protein JNL38_15795 [Myxococcales bacterium]|nr:hypothetical protein [Myxococcales bacterium]